MGTLWRFFSFPGYLLILIAYYFPTEWGKDRNTAITARQLRARNFFAPFYSIFIWALAGFFLYAEWASP